MIAARLGALLLSALCVLIALGATQGEMQPSAQRVAVAAVFALLAPMFWPGHAGTPARTALRGLLWCTAAALLAASMLRWFGGPTQSWVRIATTSAMLWLILLPAHGLAAGLDALWRRRAVGEDRAHSMAGHAVSLWLALLGALPLWIGPSSESLSRAHPWAIDAVIGASPLTHLAVASGNDLLRNQWLYQHSNLASLQFAYPEAGHVAWAYVAAILLLGFVIAMLEKTR